MELIQSLINYQNELVFLAQSCKLQYINLNSSHCYLVTQPLNFIILLLQLDFIGCDNGTQRISLDL